MYTVSSRMASSEKDANGELDCKKLSQEILKTVAKATQDANGLPKLGTNYELYSSYPVFAEFMNMERERILKLLSRLLRHSGCKTNFSSNDTTDTDEQSDRLIYANDSILERIGNCLDEATGIRKKEDTVPILTVQPKAPSWIAKRGKVADVSPSSKSGFKIPLQKIKRFSITSKNIPKPQLKFHQSIDNRNERFRPKLKIKHNAKKSWKGNIRVVDNIDSGSSSSNWSSDAALSQHPYQYELEHFKPKSEQLTQVNAVKSKSLDDTPLTMVKTTEQLEQLVNLLNNQKEFAVDLEHNDYRSYLGLTCLVQISTRDEDFIIDTFLVWEEMHRLNEPFTNPNIVKVFHGADSDVCWLQRDFGVYLVNLFDTGRAMRVLNFPRFSLLYLVQRLCDVTLEKQYQLSDWRERPLPDEYVQYARSDTHYLLYCYDRLRNLLLETADGDAKLLESVYSLSRKICRKVYEKPLLTDDSCAIKFERNIRSLNNRQTHALNQLFVWRDKVARDEDESLAYILPDHMMLQIAEVLPKEMQGILACCNPIPTFVKQELHELHRIIMAARDLTLERKEIDDVSETAVLRRRESTAWLYRPHDFSHSTNEGEEIRPLSQRLITKVDSKIPDMFDDDCNLMKKDSSISIFDYVGKARKENNSAIAQKISPYEQYLLAKEETTKQMQNKRELEDQMKDEKDKKRRYSHKDPSTGVGLLPRSVEPIRLEAVSAMDNSPTFQELKKKKKREKPDLLTNPSVDKKKHIAPFDYSKYGKEMFNDSKTAASSKQSYDPNRLLRPPGVGAGKNRKKSEKGARKTKKLAKFGRSSSKTMSF